MSEQELKPCPFCGEKPTFDKTEVFYGFEKSPSSIKCACCNYRVSSSLPNSDEIVLRIWNTRPIEDALRSEISELHAKNSELLSKYLRVDDDVKVMLPVVEEAINAAYHEFSCVDKFNLADSLVMGKLAKTVEEYQKARGEA